MNENGQIERNDSEVSWKFMVRPQRDLFCFHPTNRVDGINWMSIFSDLPFSSHQPQSGYRRHVAFSFDPSWILRAEQSDWVDYDIGDDIQSFLFRSLRDFAFEEWPDVKVWIIDDQAMPALRPLLPERKTPRKIFHDCHHEYVEIKRSDLTYNLPDGAGRPYNQTALRYVDLLLEQVAEEWEFRRESLDDNVEFRSAAHFEHCVGVLVPRKIS